MAEVAIKPVQVADYIVGEEKTYWIDWTDYLNDEDNGSGSEEIASSTWEASPNDAVLSTPLTVTDEGSDPVAGETRQLRALVEVTNAVAGTVYTLKNTITLTIDAGKPRIRYLQFYCRA